MREESEKFKEQDQPSICRKRKSNGGSGRITWIGKKMVADSSKRTVKQGKFIRKLSLHLKQHITKQSYNMQTTKTNIQINI